MTLGTGPLDMHVVRTGDRPADRPFDEYHRTGWNWTASIEIHHLVRSGKLDEKFWVGLYEKYGHEPIEQAEFALDQERFLEHQKRAAH